jgi:hypothetical protein
MKDETLEKYYERQFDLFAMEGWDDFLATVEVMLTKEDNILGIKDMEDLFKRQGRIDILKWIKSWPQFVEQAHKQNIENETNL